MNITVTPQPAIPGQDVIVCVFTIPPNGVAYIFVVFYNGSGEIIFAKSYKLTPENPCKTIRVPANASTGTVEDIDEVMEGFEIFIA